METNAIDDVHRASAANDPLKLLGVGKKNSPEALRFRDLYLFCKINLEIGQTWSTCASNCFL